MKPKLCIVVPCYNEEEILPLTNKKLLNKLETLTDNNIIDEDSFILYVNDGSKDNTWQQIIQYYTESKSISGINLSGNVGHQKALIAGLEFAYKNSDISISIDADLQDDIDTIDEMINQYLNGFDIVYGVRNKRETDTWFKRNTAILFYKIMNSLGTKTIYNHADFRLMSKRAMAALLKYPERNLFIRGLVPLLGYNTTCVYYNRLDRLAGESKYPLSKMINFAIDGITSFSTKPVRMIFTLGIIFIVLSAIVFIYILFSLYNGITVQGWISIMISIWFSSGCILIALGIIGEYIGKIYIEVKNRPLYNIENILYHNSEK